MENHMSSIDEYDLDMYRNVVLVNNCKEESLMCIFNTSSFLNTICFFVFIFVFLWFITILLRIYNSYHITKYLKNRKAIYMKHMSRYIKEINRLCRSHVNDIIRIKKKIIPKNVEKVNLNINIMNNIQLYKNYLSSSNSDLNPVYKYSVTFSFSSKTACYVRLYWGVLLDEVNDLISSQVELSKQTTENKNTVICIGNFKNFFKDGFAKRLPSIKKSDATTSLLDKKKKEYCYTTCEDSIMEFNSYYYKSPKTYFPSGNNINYTMPYDEKFCVTKILNKIEHEKKQLNEQKKKEESENKKKEKKNKVNTAAGQEEETEEDTNVRIPLIIVFTDVPLEERNYDFISYTNEEDAAAIIKKGSSYEDNSTSKVVKERSNNKYEKDSKHIQREKKNIVNNNNNRSNYTIYDNNTNNEFNDKANNNSGIETSKENALKKITSKMFKKNTYNCSTLLVLVDFKKIKDKYKPFIIKDICVVNQKNSYSSTSHKLKKNKNFFRFFDVMDIYGHEEHDKECLICMTSYKDTLLIPCRHSSFCYDCMKSLRQEKCPICRCLFTSFIKFPLKNMERTDSN